MSKRLLIRFWGCAFILLNTWVHAGPTFYTTAPIAARVVDAKTGKPIPGAVINAAWALVPEKKGPETPAGYEARLTVVQVTTGQRGRFVLPGWRHPWHVPQGWQLATKKDPFLRVYAPGYRRAVLSNTRRGRPVNAESSAHLKSAWHRKTIRLKRLPNQQARLAGLVTWRQDIESEIQAYGRIDPARALASQKELLLLFDRACTRLDPTQRQVICFDPASRLGRFIANLKAVNQAGDKVIFISPPGAGQSETLPAGRK